MIFNFDKLKKILPITKKKPPETNQVAQILLKRTETEKKYQETLYELCELRAMLKDLDMVLLESSINVKKRTAKAEFKRAKTDVQRNKLTGIMCRCDGLMDGIRQIMIKVNNK